jgi:hypothetical protein
VADTKISALTALTGVDVAGGDLGVLVDISDTTMAASGTDKKITIDELVIALQARGMPIVRRLNTQHDNATTTPTEIANGLECTGLVAGTYMFQYNIIHQAAAATTGVRFNVNFSGTSGAFVYWRRFYGLIATAADANQDQESVLAAGQVMQGWADRVKQTTAVTGVTLTADTLNANMLTIVEGSFVATGTGDLELWHGSEVAATTSVMVGTSLVVYRTA